MNWLHTYLSSKVWKVIFKRWTMWAREAVVMVFANITPMKLPLLVVTEPGRNSPITSACWCVGWLSTDHAATKWCSGSSWPLADSNSAHFYKRQHGKLLYLMASLLSQQMVVSMGYHMPAVVHKEIDLVRRLPHSLCLCLGGSFSWSRTTAMISLPLVCHTQLCSGD